MRIQVTPLLAVACSIDLVSSLALPESFTKTHVLHEKSEVPHETQWVKRNTPIDPARTLPVRIGLKQNQNAISKSTEWLMDVSDPDSPNYGKHWSQEDVIKAFAPTDESVKVVKKWISSVISEDRITQTDNKAWLAFDASAAELEALVHARYYERDHPDKAFSLLAADEYYLPEHVVPHVDYMTPGVKAIKVRSNHPNKKIRSPKPVFKPADIHVAKAGNDLSKCDQFVTPACIQALYQFSPLPHDQKVSPGNTLGIYESGDAYAQKDLDLFYANFTSYIPKGTAPIVESIDGGVAPVATKDAGGESDLDFQLAIPIIYPQRTTLYQVGSDNFFNEWLDAIDGSYCTSTAYGETGDDPDTDPKFPNHDYPHKHQCGVFKPTNVMSISYGGDEVGLPDYYLKRQCDEYKKLGLQGVSILFASGDNGVAGGYDGCIRQGEGKSIFEPGSPASCPWITSVGATKIAPGKTVNDPEVVANDPATDLYDAFSSGGGFSNVFSAPDYQSSALASYFKHHNPPYPYYTDGKYNDTDKGQYNRNGRGYPDVAANGDNTAIYNNGKFGTTGGTSASTPIFASLITRINEDRIASGKGPVGFLNPTLYKNPQVFNDITSGSNPGCEGDGFYAVTGWDPTTGLGTPIYPKMSKLFNGLQ